MRELQIHDELKAWIEPLLPEEFAQLEANILAEGCRDPIVVWDGFILDGHNRYEICSRHRVPFATVEKTGLVTREDALVWMAQNQLGRRNLSDFTRAALALQLKPLIEQRAQQRMLAGRALDSDPTQKSAEGGGETREAIAKVAGVSRDTVRKVEKILESGNAEVTAQVRAGEISINAAAKKVAPPRAAAGATLPAALPATVHTAALAPVLDASAPAQRVTLVQQVQQQQAEQTQTGELSMAPGVESEPEVDPFDQLLADYHKAVDKQNELQAELDNWKARVAEVEALLKQNDLAAQVDYWKSAFEGMSGRNAGLTKKLNQVEPEAEAQREILKQIRQKLGVERSSDILPALMSRRAA